MTQDKKKPPPRKTAHLDLIGKKMDEFRKNAVGPSTMSFKELREAHEDKNHPRHVEATEAWEQLSASLAPVLEVHRKALANIFSSSQAFKQPLLGLNQTFAKQYGPGIKASLVSSLSDPPRDGASIIPRKQRPLPSSSENLEEVLKSVTQANEKRAAREQKLDNLAEGQFKTLEAISAGQSLLAQQIVALKEQQADDAA